MSVQEPTKKDVLSIADYLGCNGEELWSEVSKLLLRQDNYARINELETLDDEHQTTSQDLERLQDGFTQTCIPCEPIWERIAQLSTELTNKEME